MSEESKKIRFEATGNLSDFMKKLQQDGKSLYESFSKEAKNQAKDQKEQFRIVRDKINALKEQLRVEKELTKEKLKSAQADRVNAKTPKEAAFFSKQVEEEEAKLNNIIEQQRASRNASQQLVDDRQDSNKKPEKKESVFNAVLMAGLVRDFFSALKTTVAAQTEFDLITPFATSLGAATGTALGFWTGHISPGLPGAIATAGKEAGAFAGAGYTRHLIAQEQAFAAANKVTGLTGRASQAPDMVAFGLDRAAGSALEESIVRAIQKGTTTEQIKNIVAISKGFSIDSSVLTSFLGTNRMKSGANEGMITGLLTQGIDRSKLGQATQNLTQMIQVLGQSTLSPSSVEAMQKIVESNRIGGPFSITDPRSMGYLSTIQSNLTDPKTAFAQALSYKVLREQNPELGVVDLLKKRQEGDVQYESGILSEYARMSGSKDFATLAYSQAFGTGNLAADELRFLNRDKISAGGMAQINMSKDSTELGMGTNELYKVAERVTTTLQQAQADVQNAFVVGFTDGIDKLAERFTDRMSEAVDKWVIDKLTPSLNDAGGKDESRRKGYTPSKTGKVTFYP